MKKTKVMLPILMSALMLFFLNWGAAWAAPGNNGATYSVDAPEIEYDLKSGDGTTSGKTTIQYDGGTATAQGGATFNSKEKTGRLFGGVVADKEDNHLNCAELILYSEHFVSAVGDAVLVKGDKTLKAPRVDYHEDKKFAETLGGTAHLSAADGSWLSAGKIVYDMKTGVASATGGVNLESPGRNMTGSGDRAVYDAHETGYIELIGNAKMTRDGNSITGDKLRITNTKGTDSKTHASGNVRIVYYPEEKTTGKEQEIDGQPKLLAEAGKNDSQKAGKPGMKVKESRSVTEEQTA